MTAVVRRFTVRAENPRRGVRDTGIFELDGRRYRWDRTDCCYWVRIRPPSRYVDFRHLPISEGVAFIRGVRPDGTWETQAVRFDIGRRFRTLDDVKAWLKKHADRLRNPSAPTVEITLRPDRRGGYTVEVYDAERGEVVEQFRVPRSLRSAASDIYKRRRERDGRAVLSYEEYVILRRRRP